MTRKEFLEVRCKEAQDLLNEKIVDVGVLDFNNPLMRPVFCFEVDGNVLLPFALDSASNVINAWMTAIQYYIDNNLRYKKLCLYFCGYQDLSNHGVIYNGQDDLLFCHCLAEGFTFDDGQEDE